MLRVLHMKHPGLAAVVAGAPVDASGYLYQPTILKGVSEGTRILSEEEIFGPVAPIITFSREDDAAPLANNTEYRLVAFVFTKDLNRATGWASGSRPACSA